MDDEMHATDQAKQLFGVLEPNTMDDKKSATDQPKLLLGVLELNTMDDEKNATDQAKLLSGVLEPNTMADEKNATDEPKLLSSVVEPNSVDDEKSATDLAKSLYGFLKPDPKDDEVLATDKSKILRLLHKVEVVNEAAIPFSDYGNIPTVDLYGNEYPWVLYNANATRPHHSRELNCFSNLKAFIKKAGTRDETMPVRTAGVGCWEMVEGQTRTISDPNPQELPPGLSNPNPEGLPTAEVQTFKFNTMSSHKENEKWFLEEYSLANWVTDAVKPKWKNVVFCTLKPAGDSLSSPSSLVPSGPGSGGRKRKGALRFFCNDGSAKAKRAK